MAERSEKISWNEQKSLRGQRLVVLKLASIDDVQRADIVIVSFAVLNCEKYFRGIIARLSGVNPASLPTGTYGSCHFTAVYNECLDALPTRVSSIVNDCSNAYGLIVQAEKTHNSRSADGSLRLDGKETV